MLTFRIAHFLVLYVLTTVGASSFFFYQKYHELSGLVISLFFFLFLNSLICIWEISLGINIDHIKHEFEYLKTKFKKKKFDVVMSFFSEPLNWEKIISLKFWSKVWSM